MFIIVLMFFYSCGPFSYERQKINYFLIWYEQGPKVDSCPMSVQFQVTSVTGADIVETTQMILKEKENTVSYIPYCRWKTTVPRMFEELLNRDIKASRAFLSAPKTSSHQETLQIKAHIYSFWAEIKNPPVLKVGVWLEARSGPKAKDKRAFQRSYERERVLQNTTPMEYASGASEIFKNVIEEFLRDLCEHLKGDGA